MPLLLLLLWGVCVGLPRGCGRRRSHARFKLNDALRQLADRLGGLVVFLEDATQVVGLRLEVAYVLLAPLAEGLLCVAVLRGALGVFHRPADLADQLAVLVVAVRVRRVVVQARGRQRARGRLERDVRHRRRPRARARARVAQRADAHRRPRGILLQRVQARGPQRRHGRQRAARRPKRHARAPAPGRAPRRARHKVRRRHPAAKLLLLLCVRAHAHSRAPERALALALPRPVRHRPAPPVRRPRLQHNVLPPAPNAAPSLLKRLTVLRNHHLPVKRQQDSHRERLPNDSLYTPVLTHLTSCLIYINSTDQPQRNHYNPRALY